jgi:hypothetical protein
MINMKKIDFRDISVVVQGAIDVELTPRCLASIRKFLPGAEIILSTWAGSRTTGLDYDELVLSRDPGSVPADNKWNVTNNVNRQIESSKGGLRSASRTYALKIRSDMEIVGLQFVEAWGRYDEFRNEDCRVFKNRVITNNLYCANPHSTNFPYHLSDWAQFGLRDDILNLWDIPTQSTHDMGSYWTLKARPIIDPVPTWLGRYLPEQYIWTTFLKKNNVETQFEHYTDASPLNLRRSELSFANNVVILNYEESGFRFLKYDPYKWDYKSQYTHTQWLLLYKKYCNPAFPMPVAHVLRGAASSKNAARMASKASRCFKDILCLPRSLIRDLFKWTFSPFRLAYYVIRFLVHFACALIKQQ